MALTGIEWADKVWNPVRGCSLISPGCKNCYAMKFAARFSGAGQPYEGLVGWTSKGPRWNGQIKLVDSKVNEPLSWKKSYRVFVNSMSDLFHPDVPDDFIGSVFAVMGQADRQTFMVLTKRADRMEQWFGSWAAAEAIEFLADLGYEWPLPNVWVGVSAENQEEADRRIPSLIATPAAIRFVSAEPLLGTIDLERIECPVYRDEKNHSVVAQCGMCPDRDDSCCQNGFFNAMKEGIDWVIVGCETGPRKLVRPMDSQWVRDLRDQCVRNTAAFFYKQAIDHGERMSLPMLDGRRWSEFPDE